MGSDKGEDLAQQGSTGTGYAETEQLFLSFVTQLQHAFLQLHTLADGELLQRSGSADTAWQTVRDIAGASVALTEGYSLQARLHSRLMEPVLEPVAVSSLLYDTAHILDPFAKQYGVSLQLEDMPKSTPVMTDREVLRAAMISLGQVFVVAESQTVDKPAVRLAAHKGRYGVVAGIYGQQRELNASALRRARQLHGHSVQPFSKLASGPVAGVFMAESLLHAVSTRLHIARYHNLTGMAATLPACNQLQLV